jgi:hypothetical protein
MFAVAEDVHEQPAVGTQPARDPREQRLDIAHVLEHLDRNHPVEPLPGVEIRRVRGQDPQVPKSTLHGALLDVRPLEARVRKCRDPRGGETPGGPQAERTPAAAELENLHPVGHACARRCQVEHRLLSGIERPGALRPEAAAVFLPRAEDEIEERRGHLVVLQVGGVRRDGDRGGAHRRDERPLPLAPGGRASASELLEGRGEAAADRPAQEEIRDEALLGEADGGAHGPPLGNQGMKALVSRW